MESVLLNPSLIFPKFSPLTLLSSSPEPPLLSRMLKTPPLAAAAAAAALRSRFISVTRAAMSEESSSGASQYATEERDGAVAVEVEVDSPVEQNVYNESPATEAASEESPAIEQVNKFLENLNIKLDPDDTYSIVLYGAGAVIAVWLASAVVGAIDSIPVFPKLMEVVGLGYSYWFTTRYLLFKKNRDELLAKIEDLKQQVLGSSNG